MKRLFFSLLIISSFCFSQVEEGYYLCKYYETFEAEDGVYELAEEGWVDVTFYFASDYFTVQFEGDEEMKIWYDYFGEEEIEGSMCDMYETEEGHGELAIDYDNQTFKYYSEYDGNIYLYLEQFSKIEKQ